MSLSSKYCLSGGGEVNALELTCGAELEQFELREVVIGHTRYTVLTGYEGQKGRCFWCGAELKGKLKRYCYGHMKLYYQHFEWNSASKWALERSGRRCENCGEEQIPGSEWVGGLHLNLEVHHIVPLNGRPRFFSAFNLPWNLIVLCHRKCHPEIHAIMRKNNKVVNPLEQFELCFV